MDDKLVFNILLWFTVGYSALFGIYSFLNRNYEFLYYTLLVSILIVVVVVYHKTINLPNGVLVGLAVLGALHVAGGNFHLGGVRLYDFWFIGGIFKYDNLMHFLGAVIATIVAYTLLYPHMDKKIDDSKFFLSLLLILLACGVGTIIELVEFLGVLLFDISAQVGGYTNTLIDLVFNFLGATTACFFLMWHYPKRYSKV